MIIDVKIAREDLGLEREWDGYPPWAWDKDSQAVVASDGVDGVVLWTVGPHVRYEQEESNCRDLSDLGLDNAPQGISVWIGKYFVDGGPGTDDDMSHPKGTFRAPTDAEWESIKRGECPWNDEDWRVEP